MTLAKRLCMEHLDIIISNASMYRFGVLEIGYIAQYALAIATLLRIANIDIDSDSDEKLQ